jgi:hypothetical protein
MGTYGAGVKSKTNAVFSTVTQPRAGDGQQQVGLPLQYNEAICPTSIYHNH